MKIVKVWKLDDSWVLGIAGINSNLTLSVVELRQLIFVPNRIDLLDRYWLSLVQLALSVKPTHNSTRLIPLLASIRFVGFTSHPSRNSTLRHSILFYSILVCLIDVQSSPPVLQGDSIIIQFCLQASFVQFNQ